MVGPVVCREGETVSVEGYIHHSGLKHYGKLQVGYRMWPIELHHYQWLMHHYRWVMVQFDRPHTISY